MKDNFLRILWLSYAACWDWLHFTLVWVPPVDTGDAPSWQHTVPGSAAHAAAKTAAWPSAAALGALTVTQDPTGGRCRLGGHLDPCDNTLYPLSCGAR